ncbi:MAG: undecaprenyl-phosphate glucose phosphotransferase [Rhodomicrobium sp.]
MSEFLRGPASLHQNGAGTKLSTSVGAKTNWPSRKMLFDLLSIYDLMAIVASAWLSYYFYLVLFLQTSVGPLSYLLIVIVTAILFHTIARQSGLYELPSDFNVASQLSSLIYVCAATIASAFVMLFFFKIQTEFSRVWVLLWVTLLLIFLTIGRAIAARYAEVLVRNGALRRKIALVGYGERFQAAKRALQQDMRHFCVASALDLSELDACSSERAAKADDMAFFIKDAQEKHVDEVIIALPSSMGVNLEKIVQQVQMLPVDVQVLPDFGGANISVRHVQHVANLPLITTVSRPISEWGEFLKIVEDYVIGVLCLILFSPAMAIIALAIKLDSEGPVLFRQRRHGYNHQVIEVLKFRTMTVLENGDTIKQATKNDKRVTRVGAFLRRTSLDEVPQFWNVIRGEMSIVGPRPHALAHNTYYGDLIENYANRHRVKPGITGWAQVNGFRGETSDPDMMAKRVSYDLEYIENWSIWLDLKTIIMTPLFGLLRRSAY